MAKDRLLLKIIQDIKALDSNVRLLAQEIKTIKRNERILARNLILLNKKLNELKEEKPSSIPEEALKELKDAILRTREDLEKLKEDVSFLKKQLQKTLTSEDVAELKYIVETVNPLEFVTYRQVGELVERKLRELGVI